MSLIRAGRGLPAPGGWPRAELVEATLLREAARFLADLQREIDAHDWVESKLTEGFAFTVRTLREHDLLNRLLETETEATVPYVTVQGAPLIATAAAFPAEEISPLALIRRHLGPLLDGSRD